MHYIGCGRSPFSFHGLNYTSGEVQENLHQRHTNEKNKKSFVLFCFVF